MNQHVSPNDSVYYLWELTQEGYGYLLKMKLWTLTSEKVQQLMRQVDLRKEPCFSHAFSMVFLPFLLGSCLFWLRVRLSRSDFKPFKGFLKV